ncbi:MAG: sodium:alanine symporter family protein [Myxococcales bacterium]|nr:sodium:alanine symporter family protein [Myxococcales bacterium]
MDFLNRLEEWFASYVVGSIEAVIFFDVAFWDPDITLPLVVLWLIVGATFFTVRFQFVNFRAFRHAIDCTLGRYTDPQAAGEITHFQALSAALSATVGLGNIAGVDNGDGPLPQVGRVLVHKNRPQILRHVVQ